MKVITLCGSSKFKEDFDRINEELTMNGNVVFSLGMFAHSKGKVLQPTEIYLLKLIHFQKIDMSDEIFVINKDGYIGTSTKLEIEYATAKGKIVKYMEIACQHQNTYTKVENNVFPYGDTIEHKICSQCFKEVK